MRRTKHTERDIRLMFTRFCKSIGAKDWTLNYDRARDIYYILDATEHIVMFGLRERNGREMYDFLEAGVQALSMKARLATISVPVDVVIADP